MTGNHTALLRRAGADTTDRELLARFAADRDEPAFAELVRRHGPAVLGVCRRAAGHSDDADDAFQAVFVVLARKAAALDNPDTLGPWLRGVAYRVGSKARRAAARRRAREVQVPDMPHPSTPDPSPWPDAAEVVEAELAALPEWHRAAVLLCDVAGLSRADAAVRLGVPEGTLSSRLNAARKKLAARLARRGVGVPAAGLAALVGGAAEADVPAELAVRAVAAAVTGASGGLLPARVAVLATEGGATMGRVIGAVATVVLAAGAVGVVAAWDGPPAPPQKPAAVAPKGALPPAPEDAKPAGGRGRLLTVTEYTGSLYRPLWSPDGRYLSVQGVKSIKVFDGQTLREVSSVGSAGESVGFLDPHTLVTYSAGGGRINSYKHIQLWDLGDPTTLTRGTPTRTLDWDPGDGYPVAVSPKGIVLSRYDPGPAAAGDRPSSGPGVLRLRVIDPATGETGSHVLTVEGVAYPSAAFAVGAGGDRLLAAYQVGGGKPNLTATRVDAYSLPDGKRLWTRVIDPTTPVGHTAPSEIAVSADGSLAALGYERPVVTTPPKGGFDPSSPRGPDRGQMSVEHVPAVTLLDVRTGEPGPELPDVRFTTPFSSLSADGRLIAVSTQAGGRSIQVCDTRTGAVLKSWKGTASVTFAPDRPLLAILETWTEGRPNEVRAEDYRSSVGFWDLSGLVKTAP